MASFRAANEFRHPSERRAADALAKALPQGAQLIGNYVLPGRLAGGEIDLVVVLAEGIVVVEVKRWCGRVLRVGSLVEFEDGYTVSNPFPGLQYKTKMLRTHLINRGLVDRRLPVAGCMVVDGNLALPDEVCAEEHVFLLKEATRKGSLASTLSVHGGHFSLDNKIIRAIADALAEDTDGTETWRVGSFVIDQELPATTYTRQFMGRCTHIYERDAFLRSWEVEPLAQDKERKSVLRKLEAEASALARLESNRCRSLPIVYDAFRDPANFDVFWLAHEFIGSETLASSGHKFVKNGSFRSSVLAQLDEAMATLAGAGIVHRNLGLDVVYVGRDDRILIGGWEFSAATDGRTQRRTIARRSRLPPEVAKGASDSHAGDMFAVGLMILDLLVPGESSPDKRLRKICDRKVAGALAACLDGDVRQRARSLEGLRSALKDWSP